MIDNKGKTVSDIVINRLKQQRKDWRKNHPHGFVAKPIKQSDGTQNLLKWQCQIPGPSGSVWGQGFYRMTIDFANDYPVRPPKCVFKPVLPHPNIYPSGTVCLSILNQEQDWKPYITIRQIMEGIQKLLRDQPNLQSPAQYQPCQLFKNNKDQYNKRAKEFALAHRK